MTRGHVKVALSGDGGDELFAGYPRYRMIDKLWRGLRWLPRPARDAVGAGTGLAPEPFSITRRRCCHRGCGCPMPGSKLHRVAALLSRPGADGLFVELCRGLAA